MRSNLKIGSVLFVICGLALGSLVGLSARETGSDVKLIDYRDIPDRVNIVGALGVPVNTIVTINGHWVDTEEKDSPIRFRVEKLNGKPVKEPVDFWTVTQFAGPDDIPNNVGIELELRGVETAKFDGYPAAVYDEWENLTGGPSIDPGGGDGPGLFTTTFVVIKILSN